jgi:hypothetical protein
MTDDRTVIYLSSVIRLLSSGGAIAQLGERLLCKQEVVGSIPSGSTSRGWLVRRETLSATVIRPQGCMRLRDI